MEKDKKTPKLSQVLALTDDGRTNYKNNITDATKFFKKENGVNFRGHKNTYTPFDGTVDEPSKRGVVLVASTVDERLQWVFDSISKYVDNLFTQERSNANGHAKANLFVDGKDWGEFTSLELLKLKSLLKNGEVSIKNMISNIPVRDRQEIWFLTNSDDYTDKEGIYETERVEEVNKTTIKESYILPDPNFANKENMNGYTPIQGTKNTIKELGKGTRQKFSGEWSELQRANALKRIQELDLAVTDALKRANDVPVVASDMKAKMIFDYVFYGKNKEE